MGISLSTAAAAADHYYKTQYRLRTMSTFLRMMIVAVAVVGCVVGQDCARWCKDDQGRLYCCSSGPVGTSEVHPGTCPPIRKQCTDALRFQRPQVCSDDGECAYSSKCCFDKCLDHHTCKPAQLYRVPGSSHLQTCTVV